MIKYFNILTAAFIFTIGSSSYVQAADCVVHYKRTACAGQEEISYKKCGGEQECSKDKHAATTKEECLAAALKSCGNKRFDITKYKEISATFKGEQLVGGFSSDGSPDPSGANFCSADHPELNRCDE